MEVAADPLLPLPREVAVAEGDAVGDLEGLPVLIRVEVGLHQQRIGRAEDEAERPDLAVGREEAGG